jgi:hypothetical protein
MFVPGMVSGYINPGLQVPWQDSPSFHWYPSSTPITAHYITRQNGLKWLAYTSTLPFFVFLAKTSSLVIAKGRRH